MPKSLTFELKGTSFSLEPVRIDRKKMYGWSETVAYDTNHRPCSMVMIDDTGTIIIPKGGTGLGLLDGDGKWVDSSSLKAVDAEGNPVEKIPSSFSAPVLLSETATSQNLLDHSITSIYVLRASEQCQALVEELRKGIIYTFNFNYREDYEDAPAFLIESQDTIFLLVGKKNDFEYIALEQTGAIEEEVDTIDEDDELDFTMM
jgi:hypothetical protein